VSRIPFGLDALASSHSGHDATTIGARAFFHGVTDWSPTFVTPES